MKCHLCSNPAEAWGYYAGKAPSLVCTKHGKLAVFIQYIIRKEPPL